MYTTTGIVEETVYLEKNCVLLKFRSPEIAKAITPGQFLNIKVSPTDNPLLRRPFSVCDVDGESLFIMLNIVGEGTRLLINKRKGDELEVIGPLGNGFTFDDEFDTAVMVGGGIGVAPFPFLTHALENEKEILSFIGGRTKNDVVTYELKNVYLATDDGSTGYKGTVIDLLLEKRDLLSGKNVKLFGCGPNRMLRALQEYAEENNMNCEISTEAAMACGFGICQGCPIESAKNSERYSLVCKDGPVFNAKDVILK